MSTGAAFAPCPQSPQRQRHIISDDEDVGGFDLVEPGQRGHRLSAEVHERQRLRYDDWLARGEQVIVAKPLTFMNLSGQAVAGLAGFYKIEPADIFIVTDDVALPLGRLRARRDGSAGGHNGLKSLIQSLATQAFPRMRVGVGRGDNRRDLADHVLGRFEADERETVSAAVLRAADASEMFLSEGIERVMNVFNAAEQTDPAE